jgi:hypothetical protein
MAGSVTGVGTTFGLPNYQGQLFGLTPADTPLLSTIGGLTGGGKTLASEFEWQTYDLRAAGQNTVVEGATAPTAQARVRGNVRNVCEIHQETVSLSYTKQASIQQMTTPSSAPYNSADGLGDSGQVDEMTLQLGASIKQIARDVNFSFWNGVYRLPTSNSNSRRTRGLLNAVTTNVIDKSVVSYVDFSSATDTITGTHALSNGDKVVFTDVGDTPLQIGRVYYVVNISTTVSFKVALTSGGAAITLGTSTSNLDMHKLWATDLTTAVFEDLVQAVFDNGGLTDGATATVACNSAQKRALTAAYATAYDGTDMFVGSRTVGGVALQQIQTDFGVFNLLLDRAMPVDAIAVVSLDELMPVFLETPGKGVFFAEPLAKTGAFDAVQLYGEVGLKYGAETSHGVLRGLKV